MSQNCQTYFNNLAANAARFLKCVGPFWDIVYLSVKTVLQFLYFLRDPSKDRMLEWINIFNINNKKVEEKTMLHPFYNTEGIKVKINAKQFL